MKYFDLSTVYTAILTCNLLLAIISVIIRNEKILLNVGYKLISIFLVITAIRFMLPFEVPFATTIPLPEGISRGITWIFQSMCTVLGIEVTPLHLIMLGWFAGIIIQGYRYYRTNRQIYAYIFTYGKNVSKDARYADFLSENCDTADFRIYEISDLQTPLLYGFFRPYILLPKDYACSEQELGYILKHEVMHYKHHDLLIKCLVRLLSIIYWWNPFCYLLNRQIDLVLEMRIDDSVAGLDDKEISEYLHTLLNLAEYQDTLFHNPLGNVISFSQCNNKVLTKRFHMLMHRGNRKHWEINLVLIGIVGILYVCSFLFALEPCYASAEAEEISLEVSDINSFLVDNGDGTYDVYFNNIRIVESDSREHYSDDIPVYTREEFERVQENNPE